MANGAYKNSIMLGVQIEQKNDVQAKLNSLIKELNNSKITLDVSFKDNSVIQSLDKINNILIQTKQNASNINLGNLSNVLKQTMEEAGKLTSELKNISSINLKIDDGQLKGLKISMQDTESEAKKLSQTLKDTNSGGSAFSGITDFLAKVGLFYGVAQAVSEIKTQFTNCFQQAERLNQAFTDISITMNISKEQFANMSNQITAMGVEYGKSGNEIMNIAKTYANAQSSVDEVMAKTKPDLFLANVSRIDSADITKTIQSITNQFGLMTKEGMSAEEATMKVGNSLVATSKNMQFDFVDGIKKITEAVKVGGSIAENSKMSLDDFISMAGAFVQQSGQSGAEFSNSLKMVSARILKQKELGAELGLQAKDYAEAENALKRFDITTRDTTTGGLRSLTDILKDTSIAFSKMNDSDRQYMANKLAGVNQSARFIDIMKSMQTQQILYNATQTDTNALYDAQQKYAESLEGRLGSLKATYEGLMNKMMNSDQAKWLVTEATNFLNVLSSLDGKSLTYIATIGGLTIAMAKLVSIYKELKTLSAISEAEGMAKFITVLLGMNTVTNSAGVGVKGLEGAFVLLGQGIEKAIASSMAFIATPLGATITIIGTCLAVAVAGFVSYEHHQQELIQKSKDLKKALADVNEELKRGNIAGAEKSVDEMKKSQSELLKYIELKKKLQEMPATSFNPTAGGSDQATQIAGVQKKIDELSKTLKDAGYTVDETTGKVDQLIESEDKIANTKIVENIKAQTQAQLEHRENMEQAKAEFDNYISSVQGLYTEYQNLSAQETLSGEQKTQLGGVVDELQSKMGGLKVTIDENGQAHISNNQLIEANIEKLQSEGLNVQNLSDIRISDAKACSSWQVGNTQVTYNEIQKRISYYKAEIAAIQASIRAKIADGVGGVNSSAFEHMSIGQAQSMEANSEEYSKYKQNADALREYEKALKSADEAYKGVGGLAYSPSKGGGGDTISANPDTSGGEKGKKAKEVKDYTEEIEKLQSTIKPDRYIDLNNAIKDLDSQLTLNKTLQDSLEKGSPEFQKAQNDEIALYLKKQEALANLNEEQKKERDELKTKLASMSFQFDQDGKLINGQQRILELQKSINEMGGSTQEQKKEKQEWIDWLKQVNTDTQAYCNLVDDKIPKTTNEWQQQANQIAKTRAEIEKLQEESVKTLKEDLVKGLKEEREKAKEDKLDNLENEYKNKKDNLEKEYKDEKDRLEAEKKAEADDYEERIKALQKQLDELDEKKENKAEKLKALQAEYENWQKDDSSFGKKNRDELAKEIKDLQIDMQKDAINKQIDSLNEQKDNANKSYEEQIKETDDYYKKQIDDAEKHYNKMKKKAEDKYKEMLSDKKIYEQADELITTHANEKMLKILTDSSESYKNAGSICGKNFKDALKKEIEEALQSVKDLTASNEEKKSSKSSKSSKSNSSSKSSSSKSSSGKKNVWISDGANTQIYTDASGTESKGSLWDNGIASADMLQTKGEYDNGFYKVYDKNGSIGWIDREKINTWNDTAQYETGGRTPSNIPNSGAFAILHKNEKILNENETREFDAIFDFITKQGSILNQLTQQYPLLSTQYSTPALNTNLDSIARNMTTNNNNTTDISQPIAISFGDIINNNLADKGMNMNDIKKGLNDILNSTRSNKIW